MPTEERANEPCYILRLDSRLVWNLTASERGAAWLERLAAVMGLESGTSAEAQTVQFTRRTLLVVAMAILPPTEPNSTHHLLPIDGNRGSRRLVPVDTI